MRRARGIQIGGFAFSIALGACVGRLGDNSRPQDSAHPSANPDDAGDGGVAPTAFFASEPRSYVAKVKTLLTALSPTDAEVKSATQDPSAMRGLIDSWMARPEFREKMLVFFRNAFQQGQLNKGAFDDQYPNGINLGDPNNAQALLMANLTESFARTVWDIVQRGAPLTEAITTRRFMMTTAVRSFYGYLDEAQFDDADKPTHRLLKEFPKFSVTYDSTQLIPVTESVDRASPNFMHWSLPHGAKVKNCPDLIYTHPLASVSVTNLFSVFMGALPNSPSTCNNWGVDSTFIANGDFDDWQLVTVRPPAPGVPPTDFFNLPALRKATELVLDIPRVGFFSTPAFFANWTTNNGNQARVTMNQTAIVALGTSFDDKNSITPVSEVGLNAEHAAQPACLACHKTLDPMREFFRQAYTLHYHQQLDPKQTSQAGVFALGSVTAQGKDIYDLATMLSKHPRFAAAWTQKLCYWANSAACSEDDPEFLRVVDLFSKSNFDFKVLVRELMSSPLVTVAAHTKTFDDNGGAIVSLSRRDHLCAALSHRLSVSDVCGIATIPSKLTVLQRTALAQANALPVDSYSRGGTAPSLETDPSLFTRAGLENLCRAVADQVIDAPLGSPSRYSSASPTEAIADFVQTIMAVPVSDARSAALLSVLKDHFASVQTAGLKPADALKSTFVLACIAPSSTGIGF
ncbi:MAG: hypothetical protein NVS3B20_10100 [Polyangiales bacterium]